MIDARGGERAAVRAKCQAEDPIGVSRDRSDQPPVLDVPQPDHHVVARGREHETVRTESHSKYLPGRGDGFNKSGSPFHIPENNRPSYIETAAGQRADSGVKASEVTND